VRLVDSHQGRAQRPHLTQAIRLAELLRRDEQEAGPPGPQVRQRLLLLPRGLRGTDPDRPEPVGAALVERQDLVLLQRQQRRDDHGRAGQQRGRHLVDGGLARAGRQHDEGVAAAQHRPHGG
jgi:hypothetical protein